MGGSSDSHSEDYYQSESVSDSSETLSDGGEDYETFLFGKTVKPTYIEREEELQKEEIPEFNDDLYSNNLIGQYDRMGEIRSTLESEVMILISSLIIRESLDISSQNIYNPQINRNINNKAQNSQDKKSTSPKSSTQERIKSAAASITYTLLKNISNTTGNAPIGRFNSVMSTSSQVNTTTHLINVTSVSPQAIDSLRDLSSLLQRERGNIYHECDGIILSQHPRFATMYILENRIVETHLLPLLEVIEKTFDEANQRTIVGEILGILNQLFTPPAKEWLEHWQGVDRQIKKRGHPPEVSNHPEFMKQLDITYKYANGLAHLKRSLNQTFYNSLVHLRLEIQNWRYNGYRNDQRKREVEQMKLRQAELLQLRDTIINESQKNEMDVDSSDGDGDEDANKYTQKGRLKKNKARTNRINVELLEVQKELLKDADEVRNAGLRADIQSNLIRNFVYNLIKLNYGISASEYIAPLVMICDNEHVTLLDIFMQEFLEIFQSPSVQMGLSDYTGARVSYIHPDMRAKLWEFLRLIHVIMMAIPDSMDLNISRISDSSAQSSNLREINSNVNWINPRAARIQMAKLRQANKQTRHYRYCSLKHTIKVLPFEPLFYAQYSISPPTKTTTKRMLEKIRSFVGVDEDFDLIHKLQPAHTMKKDHDNGDENERELLLYNLGTVMNALSYDLLRDAGDDYSQDNDWKILVSVHIWVVEHYASLFTEINKRREKENLTLLLSEYMLVSLKSFIGQHSTLTSKLLPELFSRLQKNGTLTVKNAESFYLIFRLISADLHLIRLHSGNSNSNVLQICRDAVGRYLGNKLVRRIFWVLSKWKPITGVELITSALHLFKLLKQLIGTLGYVEYSPIANISLGDRLDIYDDISDDEVVGLKKVTLDNLYHKDHRQLRCGKIIASLIGLLSYSVNPLTNDLIIRYLEEALAHGHHAICWDLPSMQSLYRIVASDSIWANPQTRWVGQFAFDIVESFFLKWNRGNLFLPLELWFFKNKRQSSAYSPTSPMHLQSLLKSYGEDTIDFEISRHLKYKLSDVTSGKYATAAVVNEAIGSAIEVFEGSGDLGTFKTLYSNKLPTYSDYSIRSISQYISLTNLPASSAGASSVPMKLILGNHTRYFTGDVSGNVYSVTVSERVLSSLKVLHMNVIEAIEIAEIQSGAVMDEMANLIEIPNLSEFKDGLSDSLDDDMTIWDAIVSKLGLKLVTFDSAAVSGSGIDNVIKMYSFGVHTSLIKDRFDQMATSTRQFTCNTVEFGGQTILDIAADTFEKVGYDLLKRLIDKAAIAAESLVRYLQMGQNEDNVTIPFTASEMQLASNGQLKPLMDALGIVKFDLKHMVPYQILRLKNILDGLPVQVDEILSLSMIVQYIFKFGQNDYFEKCYEKIIEWDDRDLIIEFNTSGRKSSKVEEFFRVLSLALCANCYTDKIVLPSISKKWAKKVITFMNMAIEDFTEAEILARIREWRMAVANGYNPLTAVGGIGSLWNVQEIDGEKYDSDFELDGMNPTPPSGLFASEGRKVVSDDDNSPYLGRTISRRASVSAGDLPDDITRPYTDIDTLDGVDEDAILQAHMHSPSFNLDAVDKRLKMSQLEYIRLLHQNSLNMARAGVSYRVT